MDPERSQSANRAPGVGTKPPWVVPVWPALVALGVVVLLSTGMLWVDAMVDQDTTERTAELVEDSLRSIGLAEDLRQCAFRLSQPDLDPATISRIRQFMAGIEGAYAPLANGVEEAVHWAALQTLLADLESLPPQASAEVRGQKLSVIEALIQRLIEINQHDARVAGMGIESVHQGSLYTNVVVMAITFVLAVAIGIALLRALRRQRMLLSLHLQSLDERSRELEAFAGRTAHDLKGPLTPIVMGAEVLNESDQPRVREIAGRIRRSAERLTGIIDDLLALSVAGHPKPGHVHVGPVVAEVLEDLGEALRDADVDVRISDVTAACSTGVLSQLLRNLVTNSAKYRSPDRKLALTIQARPIDDTAEICVIDNGVGMDPAAVAQATEPYFRAVTASGAGHGLGLAIVKRTVESIGGTLDLASVEGEGTRITVRVPQL